ncbi:MAG: S8 family serine peptidase [Chitinophagaceae bacterium]
MIRTVSTYLNQRIGAASTDALCINHLQPGDQVDVAEVVAGTSIEGNAIWFRGTDGNFYWSGGFEPPVASFASIAALDIVFPPALVNYRKSLAPELAALTGNGIRVAVIDDGIEPQHPDLQNAFTDVIDVIGSGVAGKTHGTGIAGIIGARSSGTNGVIGVAPACTIIPIRAFEFGIDNSANVVKGISEAIRLNADVINISLSLTPTTDLTQKINEAAAKGIKIIASSGDQRELIPTPTNPGVSFPGRHPQCISVASCRANILDMIKNQIPKTAPLHFIGAHVPRWQPSDSNTHFYMKNIGSSFIAAFISGMTALILSKFKAQGTDIKTISNEALLTELRKFQISHSSPDFMKDDRFAFEDFKQLK